VEAVAFVDGEREVEEECCESRAADLVRRVVSWVVRAWLWLAGSVTYEACCEAHGLIVQAVVDRCGWSIGIPSLAHAVVDVL